MLLIVLQKSTQKKDPYNVGDTNLFTLAYLVDILDVVTDDGDKGSNDGGYVKVGTGIYQCDRHEGLDISCWVQLNVENVMGSGLSGTIRAAGSFIGNGEANQIDYVVTDVTGAFADLPSMGFIPAVSSHGMFMETDRSVHGEYSSRVNLDFSIGPTGLSVRVQLYRPEDQLLAFASSPRSAY